MKNKLINYFLILGVAASLPACEATSKALNFVTGGAIPIQQKQETAQKEKEGRAVKQQKEYELEQQQREDKIKKEEQEEKEIRAKEDAERAKQDELQFGTLEEKEADCIREGQINDFRQIMHGLVLSMRKANALSGEGAKEYRLNLRLMGDRESDLQDENNAIFKKRKKRYDDYMHNWYENGKINSVKVSNNLLSKEQAEQIRVKANQTISAGNKELRKLYDQLDTMREESLNILLAGKKMAELDAQLAKQKKLHMQICKIDKEQTQAEIEREKALKAIND